jgi:hypothetical protein
MARRWLWPVAVALAVLLVAPVIVSGVRETLSRWRDESRERTRAKLSAEQMAIARRPPKAWPIQSEDFRRHPRQDFGVAYRTSGGFGLDTFAGTASKDLIMDRDTTIRLSLPEEAIDTLYAAAIREHIFDLPDEFPLSSGGMLWSPQEVDLRVASGGGYRLWHWSTGRVPWPPTDEWKRLSRFLATLDSVVAAQPAYRALPRPRGMYID